MAVTIELPPNVESTLLAQAQLHGLPLNQYLQQLLIEQVPKASPSLLTSAERAEIWRQLAKDLPQTPLLSDYAVSRESIYELEE